MTRLQAAFHDTSAALRPRPAGFTFNEEGIPEFGEPAGRNEVLEVPSGTRH